MKDIKIKKPILPAFEFLKFNRHNHKLIINLGGTISIMVDPTNVDVRKVKDGWFVIKNAYDNHRQAFRIGVVKKPITLDDLLKLANYSKEYQVWLQDMENREEVAMENEDDISWEC